MMNDALVCRTQASKPRVRVGFASNIQNQTNIFRDVIVNRSETLPMPDQTDCLSFVTYNLVNADKRIDKQKTYQF